MEEVENSVIPEIAPPETESHEQPEAQAQEAKVETPVEDKQEKNWRQMRMRQNELERKLKEKDEMLEKFMQMQLSQQPQKQEVDEFDAISDEEFIPKGKVKGLVKKEAARIAQDIARQEAEKLMQQQHQSQFMDRLKRQYSDFDEIVNAETLALLEEKDPELATTIAELKDPYKIGLQSYKYIKAMNLSEQAPEVRRSKEIEKKLEKNSKTVQSPQAFDKRPMAQAFRLTDAEKTKLYEEMQAYASQAGFSY